MSVQSKGLRRSKLLDRRNGEGDDPMSTMGNLMDVMLVFACGLLIALIAHYNVDFSNTTEIGSAEVLEGELTAAEEGAFDTSATYAELGTVYQDTETGELYVVSPNDGEDEGEGEGE